MKGIPQGRYTKEFREEAVKLVTEEKLSLPEAIFADIKAIPHFVIPHILPNMKCLTSNEFKRECLQKLSPLNLKVKYDRAFQGKLL